MSLKPFANYAFFTALDLRVGRILKAEKAQTRKPTYRLTVDFGPEIGVKESCGAYRNYPSDFLVGKQVVGVVNFPPKKMGPEISEVLILGVANHDGDTIFLMPQQEVQLGVEVF